MRAILDIPQTDTESTLRVWRAAFDVDANPLGFAHSAALMRVTRGDIYSGKLPYTSHFFSAVANGGVHLMHIPEANVGLVEILDILAIIVMHYRLSRAAIVPLRAPAFWLREQVREDGSPVVREVFRPVLPFAQLESLTGLSDAGLRAVLQPVFRDGALRAVHLANGTEGICLVDGYANMVDVRRYFRI